MSSFWGGETPLIKAPLPPTARGSRWSRAPRRPWQSAKGPAPNGAQVPGPAPNAVPVGGPGSVWTEPGQSRRMGSCVAREHQWAGPRERLRSLVPHWWCSTWVRVRARIADQRTGGAASASGARTSRSRASPLRRLQSPASPCRSARAVPRRVRPSRSALGGGSRRRSRGSRASSCRRRRRSSRSLRSPGA